MAKYKSPTKGVIGRETEPSFVPPKWTLHDADPSLGFESVQLWHSSDLGEPWPNHFVAAARNRRQGWGPALAFANDSVDVSLKVRSRFEFPARTRRSVDLVVFGGCFSELFRATPRVMRRPGVGRQNRINAPIDGGCAAPVGARLGHQ